MSKNGSLRKKLILVCLSLVTFPVVFLGLLIFFAINNQLVNEYQNQLKREALIAAQNAQVVYELAEKKLASDLKLARQFFKGKGSWKLDKDGSLLLSPASGAPLKMEGNTELVDQVGSLTGGMATIFQLKKFAGANSNDELSQTWTGTTAYYRVSTSVRKADGNRAVGTIVSKPVFDTLSTGQTFEGRAVVVSGWFMTAYEPIKDDGGQPVGALFVGVPESDFQQVFIDNLAKIKIADSGSFFLIDDKGKFVLSPEGQSNQGEAQNRQDTSGTSPFIKMMDQGSHLKANETTYTLASWASASEPPVPRLVSYSYFAPWKWLIGTQVPAADFQRGLEAIRNLTMGTSLVAIFIALVFLLLFSRRITRPLIEVTKATEIIVQGNFHIEPLKVHGNDETARLAQAFNTLLQSLSEKARVIDIIASGDLTSEVKLASDQDGLGKSLQQMQLSLQTLLHQVRTVVEQVSIGADQVSQASQSLSQGSVEQSSALQEISERAQNIKDQAAENSQNLVQSNKIFLDTKAESLSGRDKMKDLVGIMERISQSSEETKKIVKAIDDISFQINLLALNANVEAARAGKYGRGFNVVAEEVRVLANKSGESVKETTQIVETISAGIVDATQASKDMAQKLEKILTGIQASSELIQTVTQASQQEAETLAKISGALGTAESITHSNSAGAEESAAAAEELAGQVQELRSMVARFKLNLDK